MEQKKYLPIGTVVLLKNSQKRLMIIGFCTFDGEDNEKIYDYSGCFFPEGLISSNQIFLFNHNQIERIYSMGFVDNEAKEFQDKLKKIGQENPSRNF